MSEISAERLRELHRIHQQLADLNDRIQRGPRQLRAGTHAVGQSEQKFAELKEAKKKMRMQYDEQNLQLKQREAKIADLERKRNECKTNVEFSGLKDQIAAEEQASGVLEDEILEKLERLDVLESEMEAAEQLSAKLREELAKTQSRVDEQQAKLDSELERVTQNLNEAEAALPPDFKREYKRLVNVHGPEGLAPVEGETCGGCHTMLTPQTMNELYLSRIVFCKSCGCILYLGEGREVG